VPKPSSKTPEIVELTPTELEGLFQRLENSDLSDNDKRLFKGVMQAYMWMKHKYDTGKMGLHKLATLLFGNRSEKRGRPGTKEGQENKGGERSPSGSKDGPCEEDEESGDSAPKQEKAQPNVEGHGRLGAEAYMDAEDVTVNHPTLTPGDSCPEECGGKLYSIDPGILLRIKGQNIANATRYHIQKLRCNTCGLVVNSSLPPEVGTQKYDERFKAILAVQKYFLDTVSGCKSFF
jgi:hypothetical protein